MATSATARARSLPTSPATNRLTGGTYDGAGNLTAWNAKPQSWNRYAYALANPLKWVDPTGEVVSLTKLSADERNTLLEHLEEFTGNKYGVNAALELVLLEVGVDSSATATGFLNETIASDRIYSILPANADTKVILGSSDTKTGEIKLDFADSQTSSIGE